MDYNDLIMMGADVNEVVKKYGLEPGQSVMVLMLDPKAIGDIDYEMYHRTTDEHYDFDYKVNDRRIDISFQNVLFRLISDKLDPNAVFAEKMAEYEMDRMRKSKELEKARAVQARARKRQSLALQIRTLFQPVLSWITSISLRFRRGHGE